jgi:hypothetical protein
LQGKEELIQSRQVPDSSLWEQGWVTVVLKATGNVITNEIEVPDRKPEDPPLRKLDSLEDRRGAILWGKVGFGTKENEEFVISGPRVSPLENGVPRASR